MDIKDIMEVVVEYRVRYHGTRLVEAREAAGLSQDDLADRLKVTQPYICKIERPHLQCRHFTEDQYKTLKAIGFLGL